MDQHTKRRMLVFGALAAALATAAPGFGAGQAAASVTVKLEAETLKITGTPESDKLNLVVTSGAPATIFVDIGADGTSDFSVDRSVVTTVDIKTVGGDDEVRVTGAVPDEAITIQGGAGNDTLVGGPGVETLQRRQRQRLGRRQPRGLRTTLLGTGDDSLPVGPRRRQRHRRGRRRRRPAATLRQQASARASRSPPTGSRVRFTRNIANIVMDLDDVDRLAAHVLGGADNIA